MVMKGTIQENHIPVNNYELLIPELPPIVFVEISGLEEETQSVDMPDRTKVSGGNSTPVEFTAITNEHHTVELAALELWRREGIGNVSPNYKKSATLIKRRIDGTIGSTRTLLGLWITKRKDADLDMNNEGVSALVEWTFSADKIESI